MRVLVFGASGTIGFPIAQALVRAGHQVIGVTRSDKNISTFVKEEFEPLVLDPAQDTTWLDLVPKLDAIIDAQGGDGESLFTVALKNLQLVEEAAKKRHETAAKLAYIYTSGTWCQGADPFETRSDGAALLNSAKLTAWRAKIEVPLRQSTVLNGIVIRPSLVYGRAGSITSMMFEQAAKQKQITWPGDRTTSLSLIHTDDLAAMYVLAVERAPIAAGYAFDAVNQVQESQDLLFHRLALLEGFSADKITYKEPSNLFEEGVITSRPLHASLARSLLGWQPLKRGLVDGLPQYYRAYKAHAGLI